ncbi:MAG: lipopolysaccharide heptosyltransferase II [Candidatus Omnitrophota bacterium]
MRSDYSATERILVIEVNWLGDCLFSTPAVRAIRRKSPGAYIAALVVPRCREVLLGNNYLDEVMVFDEKGTHRGLWGKIRLIRQLRQRRFSCVYLLRPSLTRTLCAVLAGIKIRIGFSKRKSGFLLTERVILPSEKFHRADQYHYLVAKARIPSGDRYCDFFIQDADKDFIKDFLKKHNLGKEGKLVVLHVAGNWRLKLWPVGHFAVLADQLSERFGTRVVISGSVKDEPIALDVASRCRHKPLVACGQTNLKQLGALFQRSDMVVSADSGPMHVSVAVGARTLCLFGPTSSEITGPLGRGEFRIVRGPQIPCVIPCYNLECADNICMSQISVQQVLEEIEHLGWLS